MGHPYTVVERVMSDVYLDVVRVQVWDPVKSQPESVMLSCEIMGETATSEIDCPESILQAWEGQKETDARQEAAARALREEEEEERQAEAELKAPKRGDAAVVVRGRNVPQGTRGRIIWEGVKEFGPRVGLKDADGKVHWTATSNVEKVVPGVAPGTRPPQGWVKLREEIRASHSKQAETFPCKGDRVKVLASGLFGRVFWVKDTRLGLNYEGASSTDEPFWCDVYEVAVVDTQGNTLSATTPPQERNPLEHLPAPLCHIRELREENGMWKAYSASGEFILELPAEGAADLIQMLVD